MRDGFRDPEFIKLRMLAKSALFCLSFMARMWLIVTRIDGANGKMDGLMPLRP